jgi:signal transduction histidine kinase
VTTETPGSSTLEAFRAARSNRAAFQRRMLPFLVVIVIAVAYFSARQSPHLGLHGKSLGLSAGLAGFVVGGLGVRQTMLSRPTAVRVYGPFLALLLLSSGLLFWAQPTGPGASGCIVAISVAMVAGVIPSRIGIALIMVTIGVATLVITETASRQERHQGFTGFLGTVLSFGGIFLYAMVVWRFRQHDEQSQRLLTLMEDTRDAELRAAALSERQRLAREVHDVLAHSLSGLVVQLEGARLLALSDPADGRLATTIDRAHQLAKSGLDEARRAIGMLRDDELPGPDKLAALARLFEADTGISCPYTEIGTPAELRPAVKLALYRVTQEGLTNVRKHARPERVEVRLEYLRDGVSLAVEDFVAAHDGPSPAGAVEASGGGYGLTGMRERAELLGGTLTAGPTGHGFRVLLRIPA